LVQRLKRHVEDAREMISEDAERFCESIVENPYDRKIIQDLYYMQDVQPVLVGVATLMALRTRRLLFPQIKRPFGRYYDAKNKTTSPVAAGYGFDIATSIGAGTFTSRMLSDCEYMCQKINPRFNEDCAWNFIRAPGRSVLADYICSMDLAAMRELREDKTVDQSLISKDAKLAYLRLFLEEERNCRLRFAFQKEIQREKGIADDSPMLPVRIPYPGVANDDRLLLPPSMDAEIDRLCF
jgi:hypothetical protein